MRPAIRVCGQRTLARCRAWPRSELGCGWLEREPLPIPPAPALLLSVGSQRVRCGTCSGREPKHLGGNSVVVTGQSRCRDSLRSRGSGRVPGATGALFGGPALRGSLPVSPLWRGRWGPEGCHGSASGSGEPLLLNKDETSRHRSRGLLSWERGGEGRRGRCGRRYRERVWKAAQVICSLVRVSGDPRAAPRASAHPDRETPFPARRPALPPAEGASLGGPQERLCVFHRITE